MKDELWLKKMKERLNDYSEELPSDGWQRLEHALKKEHTLPFRRQKPTRQIMLGRHWSVAAAAAVLIGISALSFWLLHSPVAEEAVRLAQMPEECLKPEDVLHPVKEPQSSGRDKYMAKVNRTSPLLLSPTIRTDNKPMDSSAENRVEQLSVDTLSAESGMTVSHSSGYGQKMAKDKARTRRKTSLDEEVILPENKQERKGWSFGLSMGGHGTATSGTSLSVPPMSGNDATIGGGGGISTGNINLSAMADGVITIPTGQTLAFKEGRPYLMGREHTLASADHHQPISVAFSVRKELGKGFSVETGLMYTYLSSDLRFEDVPKEVSQKLHYLGIPLRANWNFMETRLFTLYLSAGGAIEKCAYGKLDGNDISQRPWQFSVLGAMGAQYNLSKRVGIYAEPGVSYYFDDHSSLQTIRKERPCSFTLQAGLRLTY